MKSNKKILFLSMSCRDNFFVEQIKVVKQTWAKDIIDGKYGENVKFMSYDGWDKPFKYDKEEHVLHTRCEDDSPNTFKKTYYALSAIQQNFDFDFIFRTNTSTYVNVPLAIEFINSLEDDEVLWTSEMLALIEAPVPYPLDLYGRGNGLIFSRKLIDILLKEGINFLYYEKCDDWQIGNVLNSYYMKNGENYLDHLKSFCHGWFKSVEAGNDNGHSVCQYWNSSIEFEFLKRFMTIQIKKYYGRDLENKHYRELHSIFENNADLDIQKSIEFNKEYSKNPSIFIGSILGYISYEEYMKTDKNKLYILEAENKAENDIFKNVWKGKPWL